MRFIIVGGPPSVGKTSLLVHVIGHLGNTGRRCTVVKLDCLTAQDAETYALHGIESVTGLSTYVCPDHYLASNIQGIVDHGMRRRADYLFVESAGLCNRCSPHLRGNLAVTVLDMVSGVHAARKVGPLLKAADIVVLTRGDMISQAEREVFRVQVRRMNSSARLLEVNGLTGQNSNILARLVEHAPDYDPAVPIHVRAPLPGAVCSFCLGEQRVGETYASGNVKLLEFPEDRAGPTRSRRHA